MLSNVDYSAGDGRNSEHPRWTTEKSHVGRFPRDGWSWRGDRNTGIRAERKSVEMKTTIVRKFRRGGDLLMDSCAENLSTAKACLILPCHIRFFRCDIDGECIEEATSSQGLVFANQTLNSESYIQVSDGVELACKLHVSAEGRKRVCQIRDLWVPPAEMPLTETLPYHLLHFISPYQTEYSLYNKYAQRGLNEFSDIWRSRLKEADPKALLSAECGSLKV